MSAVTFFFAVGLLLWFGMCFVLAEIVRRVCLFAEEINHLKTRYDSSMSRVVLHVFNSRNSANFITVIILLSLLFVSFLYHLNLQNLFYRYRLVIKDNQFFL